MKTPAQKRSIVLRKLRKAATLCAALRELAAEIDDLEHTHGSIQLLDETECVRDSFTCYREHLLEERAK